MVQILLLMVSVVLLDTHQGALAADDWWMKLPYESDEFNYRAEYGQNIRIDCNDTSVVVEDYDILFWIRPDLVVMYPGDSEYFRTIDGQAGWYVNASTGQMTISLLQERQFGFYYCVLANANLSNVVKVVKKALNYEEAYFGDLWQKYEWNTIIGVSSAGGFCVISLVFWLICKYHVNGEDFYGDRYDDDSVVTVSKDAVVIDNQDSSSCKSLPQQPGSSSSNDLTENAYTNPAYCNTGDVMTDEKVSEFFGLRLKKPLAEEITTEL